MPRSEIGGPSWTSLFLALAVPTTLGFLAVGRLLNQIDDMRMQLVDQGQHFRAMDRHLADVERDLAVVTERLTHVTPRGP